MRRCQRTQHQPSYGHSALEANWKGVKVQQMQPMPHELTANQKNNNFDVSSLILHNNKPFLNHIVTCVESGFYTTTSNGHQLSGWEVVKLPLSPKPNLHQKRGHGYCLICCWSDPL